MKQIGRVAIAAAFSVSAAALAAQERSMIVLDGSGSMWGQIDGTAKIEIARQTMDEVLGAVPDETELGLLVYGHRRKGDCTDIELAVPAAVGSGSDISTFVKSISPKGKTPLSAAVRQAAEALKFTEDKATVILVTDGLETCDADPCALGRELEASGVDFTAHVVGFGLTKDEGQQVACLAEETGGQYIEASNASTLGDALTQTVVAAPAPEPEPVKEPEPAVLDINLRATAALAEDSPDLDDNDIRWTLEPVGEDPEGVIRKKEARYGARFEFGAPEGAYTLTMRLGRLTQTQPVMLTATELTEPHFVLNAGVVELTAKRAEGDTEAWGDARVIAEIGDTKDSSYGTLRTYMPAGEITLSARQGKAAASETAMLAAGETIQRELVVSSGIARVSALYAEGGPDVETNDIRFSALTAKMDLNGERDRIESTYGAGQMNLPAGEYVLHARLGRAEVTSEPFTVDAGALTDVQVVLGAGVAAMSAPGGYRIDVLGKPNMQGERKRLDTSYSETFQITLAAGSYTARVTYEDDRAAQEVAFDVIAGERTEVAIPLQ